MEQNYYNFVTTLYKFLFDVNRYVPTSDLDKILAVYKELDMQKVIIFVNKILTNNEENIKTNNATIFEQEFLILPSLNLSTLWSQMNPNQQKKVWMYLNMLTLQTSIFFSQDFNPYVGLKCETTDYGVNEMLSSIPDIDEDRPMGMGIGTIIALTGLDKMVDINKFTDELKNMTDEQMETYISQIKIALGPNNAATGDLFSNMLVNMSDEFKQGKNLDEVINKVGNSMSASMKDNNISPKQLLSAAKTFSSQCKNPDGTSMFAENNPFTMLEKFMEEILMNKICKNVMQ